MLKVLQITQIISIGNLYDNNFILDIAKRISKKSLFSSEFLRPVPYSNKFISFFFKKAKKFNNIKNLYTDDGIPIHVIKGIFFPNNRFLLFTGISLVLLNIKKLDLLARNTKLSHVHFIFPEGVIAYYLYKRYKIPYIITVRQETYKLRFPISKFIGKIILKDSYFLTTPSLVTKGKMQNFSTKPIIVLPHGVDIPLKHCNKSINYKNIINIITVSKLIKRKRIDMILYALSNLINEGINNFSYTVIGDGGEKDNLELLAKKLDVNTNFTGFKSKDEVFKYLSSSDVFILISVDEDFGISYLEALAHKNAVICTKNTGIDGLFIDGKELITTESNIDSLTDKLRYLLLNKNKIEELKMNGYIKVKLKFNWDTIISQYIYLYNKAISFNK